MCPYLHYICIYVKVVHVSIFALGEGGFHVSIIICIR